MKTLKSVLAISTAMILLMAMPGWAAEISISATDHLVFGSFAAGSGGTITVTPSGSCSAGGNVILINSNCSRAEFLVTGDSNATYLIELPGDDFVVLTGPGNDMVISSFVSNPAAGANGLLNASGSQSISVGGTLNVGSNQAAGSYSGSFSVIVQYN